jgi:hypothetical protein
LRFLLQEIRCMLKATVELNDDVSVNQQHVASCGFLTIGFCATPSHTPHCPPSLAYPPKCRTHPVSSNQTVQIWVQQ